MENNISKVVGYQIEKRTPEEMLKGLVQDWDDLDLKPATNELVRRAQKIKDDIYRLCDHNDWQLPVLKRYGFYHEFEDTSEKPKGTNKFL